MKLFFTIIIFLLGLNYVLNYNNISESFENNYSNSSNCPNMLIQEGNELHLFNSKRAKIPGVNPLKFNNLEEYVEFLEWQRSQGINCPVLFLHLSYDTQGEKIYKIRPSPTDMKGGLPPSIPLGTTIQPQDKLFDATRDDKPYNQNSYPAFDPQNQYIGSNTPLDKMFVDKSSVSPNPMDPNWGGQAYTQKLIDTGYYKDNEVSIQVA